MATSSNSNSTIHQQHHQHQEQHHATTFQPSSVSPTMMQTQLPSYSFHQNLIGYVAHQIENVDEGQANYFHLQGQQQKHHRASAAAFYPEVTQYQGCASGMRSPTLSIFSSFPMRDNQTSILHVNNHQEFETAFGGSYTSNPNLFEEVSIESDTKRGHSGQLPLKTVKFEENELLLPKPRGHASSSKKGQPKILDPKTLRRLSQNREAARKSRLRKKAYIQQLETCQIKLVQLEQELLRSKSSITHPNMSGLNTTSDPVVFNIEYARWLEQHFKLTSELRVAFVENLPENELSVFVNNWLAHFDQLIHLKSMLAKTDPLYLLSGSWKSPVERCFLWIGGFKPSQLIEIILRQTEKLTNDQQMGIHQLQISMQEGEKSLSNGLDSLSQFISYTITSDSLSSPPNDMTNYMNQMAIAVSKLSTLEDFIKQADNLRQITLHRVHHILAVRQSARFFLNISEYFCRLRALSSMWLDRPTHE